MESPLNPITDYYSKLMYNSITFHYPPRLFFQANSGLRPTVVLIQSCKSGRAFRVEFGPGSSLTLRKTSGLFWAGYDAFQ